MLLGMQAPEELAGKDVLAPVVLRNIGFDEWTPDATTLTYQWLAWDGRPLPNVGGSTRLPETVKPGGVVKLDMLVTPPAQPGSYRCAINLLHRGQSVPLLTDAATPALPIAPVRVTSPRWLSLDLSEAANGVAAAAERVPPLGGLDMLETVFPLEEFLPDQTAAPLGYTPGYLGDAANPDWPSFIFPMLRDGRATMVRGLGQAIPLPEKTARALCFVGFNVLETAPAVFTVTYADGTKTDVPVTVAGWLGGPAKNEPVMLSTRYIRTARGDDWYLRGSAFAYRLPLADKPLKSIILPASGAVCLLAITLELAEEARP
ncbi:MAG: hypothetical protein BWY76_00979 [bacterium ADurb.Bin429]|nr:MAG: hypothetical protein BWY76_00979 [bacterium ADurb.Bin429]